MSEERTDTLFELHSLPRASERDSCLRAKESAIDRDVVVVHVAGIRTARANCRAVRGASPRRTVEEGLSENSIEIVVLSTVELIVGVVGIAAQAATVVTGQGLVGDAVIERVIEKSTRRDLRVNRSTHRPT